MATSRGAYDEIVHVKVGKNPDTKTFQLHKGVLSFYSGYFAGLFRSDLAEAASGEITLEDEEVEVFDQFVVWLYSRQVASQESASFHQFVKLWLFADRRIVPLLKNSTLGAIRDKLLVEWQPQLHNLGLVYEHSAKGSGLRRFLIDFVAWTGSNGTVDRIVNECSKEVVADILRAVWSRPLPRKMSADEFRTLNLCPYHDHEDGVRCRHDHEEGMRYRHDHEEAMRYRHDHEEAMRCRHDHERCR
jgi:hypothetical protein